MGRWVSKSSTGRSLRASVTPSTATSTRRELAMASTRLCGSRGCAVTGSSSSVHSSSPGSQVTTTRSASASSASVHAAAGSTRPAAATSYHCDTGT